VISLEPQTLSEMLDAIRAVGSATGADRAAERVIVRLRSRVDAVVARTAGLRWRWRVALLEWLDPPFSCGHWSPELVRLAGGVEGLGKEGRPSRMLRWDEVVASRPEVVLIACCGLNTERTLREVPLLGSVPGFRDLPAVRSDRVYVTDGSQYLSRPGPRLVDSLEILAHTLHPDIHPLPDGVPRAVRVGVTGSGVPDGRAAGAA
jgi:iron complex transport system substrate-binding protein